MAPTTWLFVTLGAALACGISAGPVSVPKHRVYSYHATTDVYNDIDPDFISRWEIFAKLTHQTLRDYAVVKLDKVQVSLFNGDVKERGEVLTKAIPTDAEVLAEPFVFHYNNTVGLKEDEPNWSFNMKKAIASILFVDTAKMKETIVEESNLYGNCNTTYKLSETEDGLVLKKVIDVDQCGGEIQSYWSANKVVDCTGLNHEQMQRNTSRLYTFKDKTNLKKIDSIVAETTFAFHVTPGDLHKIVMHQMQTFELVSFEDVKEEIDVAKMTQVKDLKFEHGAKPMEGRTVTEPTNKELAKTTLKNLQTLRGEIVKKTSSNSWEIGRAMDNVWTSMDELTFSAYETVMEEIEKDKIAKDAFLHILPYIGNNNTLKYMQMLITSNQIELYQMFRIIGSFPNYVNDYNEELVENMKVLMNLPADNKYVKNSGILGYSNLVNKAYKGEDIGKDTYEKIVKKYLEVFKTSKDYERRMIHLLGLHNMDVGLDILLPIIEDSNESHHLRLIAINSARDELKEDGDKIKPIFMPMLKNDSLILELRVAALDILLGTYMYEEDYDAIYEYLKDEKGDQAHKHLYNYFYTTLSSYVTNTKCANVMSEISEKYLPKLETPVSLDSFLTGNYRIGFTHTGPDYGESMQVKVISDPVTKSVDSVELMLDNFVLGLETKRRFHLKLHGLMDWFITDKIKETKFDRKYVRELLEIVKKQGLVLPKQSNIHVEFIMYKNEQAVFAVQYGEDYFTTSKLMEGLGELFELLFADHTRISYPILDYLHLPSDLGTDFTLSLSQEHLNYEDNENMDNIFDVSYDVDYVVKDRTYLAITKSFDVYNPVSNVRHGAYASVLQNGYYEFVFQFKENEEEEKYLEYQNKDLVLSGSREVVRATFVEDEGLLHEFCKDCKVQVDLGNLSDVKTHANVTEIPFESVKLVYTLDGTKPYYDFRANDIFKNAVSFTDANVEVFPLALFYFIYLNAQYHRLYSPHWESLKETVEMVPIDEDPIKTQITVDVTSEDLESDDEPMQGSKTFLSLAAYWKRVKDDKLLNHFNVTFGFVDSPGMFNQSYHLSFSGMDDKDYGMICVDLDMNYPKMGADYYSVKPAKPTTSKLSVIFDHDTEPITTCDSESMVSLDLHGVFSVMKEQEDRLMNRKKSPLKKCLEESKGLKYTAPTPSCEAASEEMSNYRQLDLSAVMTIKPKIMKMFEDNELIGKNSLAILGSSDSDSDIKASYNFTFKILDKFEGHYVDSDGDVEELDVDIVDLVSPDHRKGYIEEEMLVNAKEYLGDIEGFEHGMTSTCIVTDKFVSTFTEDVVKDYKYTEGDDIIAMIDCEDGTAGLTYSVVGGKLLKIVAWMEGYKITAEPKGDAMKVFINGEELERNEHIMSDNLKVFYMADDVLAIKSSPMHIIYSREYVKIESYAGYLNKLCGLCSRQRDLIIVKH